MNPEPLHKLVYDYKREGDKIMIRKHTSMAKACAMTSLSLDYGGILKDEPDITMNDLQVWHALTSRYLKNL